MYSPPAPHETHAHSVAVEAQDSGPSETLLDKLQLQKPDEMQSSRRYSTLSVSLHIALVGIQLALVVVWARGWEHQVVFSVDDELRVARLIKGILTIFITLYSALLVFVTQSLALRRDLHRKQLLTTTHDNAVAWSGLGSAVVRLWHQRIVPASTMGVLSALTYLAGISVLHTAFPGVAAPQSLVTNQSVSISTQSLPAFDLSGGVEENDRTSFLDAAGQYAGNSLSFLPFLTPSNTLGLHEATLYDVLEPNAGKGSVRVNATGFNISCGYIPETAFNATSQSINVGGVEYDLSFAAINVIARPPHSAPDFPSPAVFYTTMPVWDSSNNTAPWINLDGFGAQTIQAFRCSLTLVNQKVFVVAQSHNLTLELPPAEKQTSTWAPFSDQLGNLSSAAFADGMKGFLNIWEGWYGAVSEAGVPPILPGESVTGGLSVADIALLQQLELYPFNTTLQTGVYLHNIENELAKIVASMFWTLGHAPALLGDTSSAQPFNVSILTGHAIVSAPFVQDRLDLNIISIIGCLLTSLVLLGLSFRFSRLEPREPQARATKIDGVEVLQTIWLYRNHPKLVTNLEQVQVPTDLNLRQAGMVSVQLVDGIVRVGEVSEEIDEMSEDADEIPGPTYPPKKLSEAEAERLGSTWTSDWVLSLVSIFLHFALVVIHLILAVVCSMGLEHRITFSLSQQSLVAWLISTLATGFITIYTAGLVFLTQTLSIKCSLRKTQMLTITHDTATAWQGVGAALVCLVHPTPSLSAAVPVFLYLAGVLILHISSPALLVVQVFNSTLTVPLHTQSLPNFTFGGYNPSSLEARTDTEHSPLLYGSGTFFYLPFINSSLPTPGLQGGMLYDVLSGSDTNSTLGTTGPAGPATATVNAVQLNMTCGYFSDVLNSTAGIMTILGTNYTLPYTNLGTISTLQNMDVLPASITEANSTGLPFGGSALFFSTVPILDSTGGTSPLVDYPGPKGLPNLKAHIFGCSLGFINGSVIIDSQSRVLSSAVPVEKNSSVWSPFQDTSSKMASTDPYDVIANDWESWYTAIPELPSAVPNLDTPLIVDNPDSESSLSFTIADLFFLKRLNLNTTGSTPVSLHQFENALAELVASMYWTLGHISPLQGFTPTSLEPNGPAPLSVSLLEGNTVLFTDNIEARLDGNTSYIILGAVISGMLLLLSLQFSVFRKMTRDEEIISGMGPLHIIWLYRSHPELETQLEQVMDPTTANLRKAGMVRTRLAGPRVDHFVE